MAVIKITIVMPYMEFIWHIRTEMSIIPFLFCNINPCPCWGQDMILPDFQFHALVCTELSKEPCHNDGK